MVNIEEITTKELHDNYHKIRSMHNDWELYSNEKEELIVRMQSYGNKYSIAGRIKKK